MVAIIGNLVVKLVGRRVKLEQPVDPPARFVEDVRHAIRARISPCVDAVGETQTLGHGDPAQFMGEEHLGRGVAGGEVVLQQIGCVVPAAAGIDLCSGGKGTEYGPAVGLMALHAQPGVVAAPLLAHELEQLVGQVAQYVPADGKGQRSRHAQPHHIATRSGDPREVKLGLMVELSPPLTALRRGLALEDRRFRIRFDQCERVGHWRSGERDGDFWVLGSMPDLVSTKENLGPKRRGKEKQAAEH